MAETCISRTTEITNSATKQVEIPPKPINDKNQSNNINEDIVDPVKDKRLNDVTEPVEKTPVDARLKNINNETVINIDIADLKQESIDIELLKHEIITGTDEGVRLHSKNVNNNEKSRNVAPSYVNEDFGSRWNKNPIWVQFNTGSSGQPMDEYSREPFIRSVFSLLFVCLLLTFGFAVFTFLVGMLMVSSYKLMCYEYGRRFPCNICGLISAVIGECLIFGFLTARFQLKIVLLALGVTCIVVLVCVGLAFTPLDFTKCYIFIVVIGVALIVFSICVGVVSLVLKERFPILHLVLCCCFIIYHSFCFTMELQIVLGGRTVELGEDDYVAGAFMLYTSIMILFFDILQCIGILDMLQSADEFF